MMETDENVESSTQSADQQSKVMLGWQLAVALAVLTVIEYIVAVSLDDPLIWLLPFVVAKAALIMEYFMHFSALWGKGEH